MNNEAEAIASLICLSCSVFVRKHTKMNGEFILNIFGHVNASCIMFLKVIEH